MNEAYPGRVRLSIHAHNNAGPKFGVCLIPGQDRCTTPHTPWHNVIVETSDGQIQVMKREMVDLSKFEVYGHPVYRRPWGFKEKVNKSCAQYEFVLIIFTDLACSGIFPKKPNSRV